MAFTLEDINALTDEQITAEIEAALMPKIANRATTYLNNNGHVVKKKDEYDTALADASKTAVQDAIDKEAAKLFGSVDTIIGNLLGKEKPKEMRTRAWVDQLAEEGLLPLTADQQTKLKNALKGQGASGGAADAVVKGLTDQIEKLTKANEEKAGKQLQQLVSRTIKGDLRNAPVLIDSSLKTDKEKNDAVKDGIEQLTTLFTTLYEGKEDDDGEVYFVKKGTDTALVNTDASYMSPLEIVKANHKMYLSTQSHQQKGANTGKEKQTGGAPTTKADLLKLASDKGLRMHSKEWKEFMKEEEAKLPKS